jgi:hypothetical protein
MMYTKGCSIHGMKLVSYCIDRLISHQDCEDLVAWKPRKKVIDVAELVVNHKGQHTHLGGTALV